MHSIYRIKINDDLTASYYIPKRYKKIDESELITWADFVELRKEEIISKEQESIQLIKDMLQKYSDHQPIITTSTGKDSSVVMHLVRMIIPDCKAIFNNTSLDVADTYIMAKNIDNCEILNPSEGFYQYIKRYNTIPSRFNRFCCRIFKSGVMVEQLDNNVPYLIFMGMRNDESDTRSGYQDEWINITEWGDTKWQGILPIRKWTDEDVWIYILMNNIDINPKYKKGYQRVGCGIACPYYAKSTWVLDDYWYPVQRKRWLNILKEDFIESGKASTLNCTMKEYIEKHWPGGVVRNEPTEEVIDEFMQYKGLSDRNIAKKYFNNVCSECGSKLKKDEVGLSMKYFGRSTNKMFCYKHLSKTLGKTKNELKEDVKRFKEDGCKLF